MIDFEALAAEFPREAVSWRAQNVTKDGNSALALAYIDARDVMNRLDQVCSPANWQSAITETAKGRVIATISIRVGDDWIAKTDGAGATDIEGDKGGISDALKRAAVQWGIGRYLYDIDSPWVPCESYDGNGGKKVWKRWKADPWTSVRDASPAPAKKTAVEMVSDETRDVIQTLAESAGVPLITVCERAGVKALPELTANKATSIIKKLKLTIEDKAPARKAA